MSRYRIFSRSLYFEVFMEGIHPLNPFMALSVKMSRLNLNEDEKLTGNEGEVEEEEDAPAEEEEKEEA